MKRLMFFLCSLIMGNQLSAQYTENGSAAITNCHCYVLTPDAGDRSGSVWNNNKIDLRNSFDFQFNVFLGCTDADGADGIVFALQPISTSVGSTGGGMGFEGITPSVGVTLDTYQNTDYNDPSYDHIDIQYNGNLTHTKTPPAISATNNNVEDCKWHTLRITWNAATKTYTAYFDGQLRITTVNDLVKTTFNNDPMVFWGFTGSTGGLSNLQQFCTALTPTFTISPAQKRCIGDAVTFYDSTISFAPLAKRYWDFGDGSPVDSVDLNPVHTYTTAGDYTVLQTVVGIDGCSEINQHPLRIGTKPIASFSMNNGCADSIINFKDASTEQVGTINQWNWDLSSGATSTLQNPSQIYAFYSGAGPLAIKLSVKTLEGCTSDTITKFLKIFPRPIANFTNAAKACSNAAVTFTDSSYFDPAGTTFNSTINNWAWNFGNGQLSATQNNNISFTTTGTNTISLTVKSDSGCNSLPVTKTINILPKPTAYFTTSTVCQSAVTSFTDSSYTGNGDAIKTWWWNLGNGNTPTTQNTFTTYTTTGDITVQLVVSDINNCLSDTLKKVITVGSKPVAAFNMNNACADSTVSFKDASTTQTGTINQWNWNLNSGGVSTLQNPTQIFPFYSGAGPFAIRLSVKTLQGCSSDTVTNFLKIFPRPIANFTSAAKACSATAVSFTDASYLDASGNTFNSKINNWAWNFGNGQSSATQNSSNSFTVTGSNTISLTVKTDSGCSSLPVNKTISILPKPTAFFTNNKVCETRATFFTDSSYTSNGDAIKTWWWNLGNGNISNTKNAAATYNTTGDITVQLLVSDINNCFSDTLKKVITVGAKPVAKFVNALPLCENTATRFTDSSTSATGTIKNWLWHFDNGDSSLLQNSSTKFTAGSHTINLTVENSAGCFSDAAIKSIFINPVPAFGFSFADACKNAVINFTGIDNSGGTINQWKWDLGDGTISVSKDTQHVYKNTATYPITLRATSVAGCSTLKDSSIIIYGTDVFAGNDTIAAPNQPIQLLATGGLTYTWSPSSGLSNSNIPNPVATNSGDQTYYLKASTPLGCETYDTINIKIYAGPQLYLPTAFSPNGDGLNDVFRVFPVGITHFGYFTIYNRYGNIIFSTKNEGEGWDGTLKGNPQDVGTYIWMISGTDYKGNKITRKGTVVLVR